MNLVKTVLSMLLILLTIIGSRLVAIDGRVVSEIASSIALDNHLSGQRSNVEHAHQNHDDDELNLSWTVKHSHQGEGGAQEHSHHQKIKSFQLDSFVQAQRRAQSVSQLIQQRYSKFIERFVSKSIATSLLRPPIA